MRASRMAECASGSEIEKLQHYLKTINDVNRLKILCLLFQGEKCVCDIEEQLGISQPLASHHLAVLRQAGLVEKRKQGTWSYYSLAREAVAELNRCFNQVLGLHKLPEDYPARGECEKVS